MPSLLEPNFKRRWIAALLSGDYKQVDTVLRFPERGTDSFCCLGVACDVLNPDGWQAVFFEDDPQRADDFDWHWESLEFNGEGSMSYVPKPWADLVGLNNLVPNSLRPQHRGVYLDSEENQVQDLAVALNDQWKWTFAQIAKWVKTL